MFYTTDLQMFRRGRVRSAIGGRRSEVGRGREQLSEALRIQRSDRRRRGAAAQENLVQGQFGESWAASKVSRDTTTGTCRSLVAFSRRAAVFTASPSAVNTGVFGGPIWPTIASPV